jgi:hypothetical protein
VPPGTAVYHLAGILYGEFRLEVAVIMDIRRDDVEASYDNGLLTVVLPKATEREPERALGPSQGWAEPGRCPGEVPRPQAGPGPSHPFRGGEVPRPQGGEVPRPAGPAQPAAGAAKTEG